MEDKSALVEEKSDKIMITRIIGEMKNNFNKSENSEIDLDVNSLSIHEDIEANQIIQKEEDNSENIHESDDKAMNFDVSNINQLKNDENFTEIHQEKLQVESPKESVEKQEIEVRKLLVNSKANNKKNTKPMNQVLKRSIRQRKSKDGESVLQSAILRKEKSYNEPARSQRPTRQLKLTPKILENLGQFSSNREKVKTSKNNKHKVLDKCFKRVKRTKLDAFEEEKCFRRSQRKSTSRFKEISQDNSQINTIENSENFDEPDSNSKLCFCTEKSNIYLSTNAGEVFCQAIDCFEDKQLGCNNLVNVKDTPMMRTSCRVPFGVFCKVHTNRMLKHNRCPSCGLFCMQGKFVECVNKHHYHRLCSNANCPHCGAPTPKHDVLIKMHSSKNPVILDKQRKFYPTAKMTFPNKFLSVTRTDRDSPLLTMDVHEYDIRPSNKKVDAETIIDTIKKGDIDELAQILGSKLFQLEILYNTTGENDSIIHFCAKNGYLSALHMFYSINAEFEILDKDQNTPLMVAIIAFKNDVVKYLIKSGASISFKGVDGMTALHLSAQHGNLVACELLLQSAINKKDYINKCDDGGWTALVWACEYSYSEIVLFFLRKGADPMVQDLKQNVALHWAACSGSQDCLGFLLDYGSNVNCVNVQGDTPLHIAAREDKYNAVILLLLREGDASLSNKLGETPIDCALENGDCFRAINLNVQLRTIWWRQQKNRIILTNDITNGRELNPIQCVNQVDGDPKPGDFVYITDYCFTSDINVDIKVTSLHQCTCEDDCNTECICAQNSLNPYDEDGKLVDFNFYDPQLIFECNNLCPCNQLTCSNRVVQKGLNCRFQVYKTESKGWAVKSLQKIAKGRFVCEYIGEIIGELEADQRSQDDYLFDLMDDNNRDANGFCIDAKRYGNVARFFNHSCDANLTPVKVFINHQDVNFPRIALFANREIQAEEELCFDYGIKYWLIKSKSSTCECKSSKCQYSKVMIEETLEAYRVQINDADKKIN
nr:histone-lysine N-methyltransferase EHMT1 [Onthophagus taurus]